jgi:hypothetical protein
MSGPRIVSIQEVDMRRNARNVVLAVVGLVLACFRIELADGSAYSGMPGAVVILVIVGIVSLYRSSGVVDRALTPVRTYEGIGGYGMLFAAGFVCSSFHYRWEGALLQGPRGDWSGSSGGAIRTRACSSYSRSASACSPIDCFEEFERWRAGCRTLASGRAPPTTRAARRDARASADRTPANELEEVT